MLAVEPLWQVYAEHREEYFAVPGTRSLGLDLELIGRHQDGTEFPINVTMSLIDTGDVLLAITRVGEVTRRKQAVAKAELLDAIVEYSHDAITGLTLEGIITSWNPAAVRMYGYSNTEVIGRPELFQPPDASELALSTHRRSPPNPASTDRQARPLAPRRPAHVTTRHVGGSASGRLSRLPQSRRLTRSAPNLNSDLAALLPASSSEPAAHQREHRDHAAHSCPPGHAGAKLTRRCRPHHADEEQHEQDEVGDQPQLQHASRVVHADPQLVGVEQADSGGSTEDDEDREGVEQRWSTAKPDHGCCCAQSQPQHALQSNGGRLVPHVPLGLLPVERVAQVAPHGRRLDEPAIPIHVAVGLAMSIVKPSRSDEPSEVSVADANPPDRSKSPSHVGATATYGGQSVGPDEVAPNTREQRSARGPEPGTSFWAV